MAEAVQHARALAQGRDGGAVFLLIEEEAGLLAIFHVHDEAQAVFYHVDRVGHLAIEQAGRLLQALQAAHRHVAALPDAFGMHDLGQVAHNRLLPLLNAQAQRLHDQVVAELVHDQAGQKVALGKDQAAAGRVAEQLAVVPGLLHAAAEEGLIHRLVVRGQHAQGNLALGVVKRPAQVGVVTGNDVHHVARLEAALDPLNVGGEYPRVSGTNAALARLAKYGLGHEKSSFQNPPGGGYTPSSIIAEK